MNIHKSFVSFIRWMIVTLMTGERGEHVVHQGEVWAVEDHTTTILTDLTAEILEILEIPENQGILGTLGIQETPGNQGTQEIQEIPETQGTLGIYVLIIFVICHVICVGIPCMEVVVLMEVVTCAICHGICELTRGICVDLHLLMADLLILIILMTC